MYKFLFKDNEITVEEYPYPVISECDVIYQTAIDDNLVMYSRDKDVMKFYDKLIEYFKKKADDTYSIVEKYHVLIGDIERLKLRPLSCPFCGGEAKMISHPHLRVYKVFCATCGAETKNCESEREVVDAWNKRV